MSQVAVLGASPKEDRYSNKAIRLLREHGHDVVPVHPTYETIENLAVVPDVKSLANGSVDTVTVYLSARNTEGMGPDLIRLRPRRVIFNPGAENAALAEELRRAGIGVEEACTLVLLNTGQF